MCIVLVLVAVRFVLWTMMAELCFSVDDFFFFFQQFQQYSNGHRKRIRQLRAPSLLGSSGFVPHMYTAVYMLAPDAAVLLKLLQKNKIACYYAAAVAEIT